MRIWPLKIIAKLILSCIPGRHVLLRHLGVFRHGDMDDVSYAHGVFKKHLNLAYPDGAPEKFTALELGPGDSAFSALIAKAYGSEKTYLVDAGAYAATDLDLYNKAAEDLQTVYNLTPPAIDKAGNFDNFLKICNATYLTNGLESLKVIPGNSVDFIWSHAVLEHVRKDEFEATMKELARILKLDGIMSHEVDLQDHLDHALNNLRFPAWFWEHDLVARAGFYTNRLDYKSSLDKMRNAGLEILSTTTRTWDALPTSKNKMAEPFKKINDKTLKVLGYTVALRRV